MSNLLTESSRGFEQAQPIDFLAEPERTLRVARFLGPEAVLQLDEHRTFARIFDGSIQIEPQTVIFDRTGNRLDTAELLSQVEGN